MTTHEINLTCKHDFLDLEHLSNFRNDFLIVLIFRYFSFDADLITIFKMTP